MSKFLKCGLLMAAALVCCPPAPVLAAADPANGDPHAASEHYEDALMRFNREDYSTAVIQLKNALRADPRHLPARVLLGEAYFRMGDAASAEKELRLARQAGADEALVVVPLAKSHALQGKYAQILDEFRPEKYDKAIQADLLVVLGEAHHALGQLDDAEQAYVLAARLRPNAAGPSLGRAKVLLSRGERNLAEDYVDIATERDPKDPEAWYVKADIRRLQGDLQGAVASYGKAIQVESDHLQARVGRAASLIDLGRNEQALADLEYVRAAQPDHPQAAYLFALVLARAGDMEAARDVLGAAAKTMDDIPPAALRDHPPSLLVSGVIAFARGDQEQAREHLRRYVGLVPNHPGARKVLGALLLIQGEPGGAIKVLRPALTLAPEDASVYALLGNAHMAERHYAEATKMLEKAAELAPDRASIRTQLALSRLATDQFQAAEADLRAALALDPESTKANSLLALMHLNQGNYDAALKVAQTIIEHEPRNPAAYNLVGNAQFGTGDSAAARASFERASALDPNDITAQQNLAAMDLAAGDTDMAKGRYQLILDHSPEDKRALDAFARIAQAEGRPVDAVRLLEKLRHIDPDAIAPQLRLFELYMRLEKYEAALEVAQAVDKRKPTSLPILEAVGRAQLALKQTDKAATTFRIMHGLSQDSAQWLQRVAKYQSEAGDLEGARESLRRALIVDPDYMPGWSALVALEARTGETAEALAHASQLQATHPQSPVGDMLKGDVLMQAERYGEAVEAYEAAQRKEEERSTAVAVRLYRARRAAGAPEDALRSLAQWVKAHPADRAARGALAVAYLEAGHFAAATQEHERLLEEQPDDPTLLNNLAWLYQQAGDPRALSYAEKAYALRPDQASTLDTLGWLLVQQGEPARGIPYLREAYVRTVRDPRVRYHLAVALSQLGREDEARLELEAALEPGQDFDGAAQARTLLRQLKEK